MIIRNSIFHVNFTIMQFILLSLQLLPSTQHKFHWPYWNMPFSSGLVSRNDFRQISATEGTLVPTVLPANIMFLGSLFELLQLAAEYKGTQYTALDQIVRYIIKALISPFLQKSERYNNIVPSLWLGAFMFLCSVIVCCKLTLQSNQ